MKFILLIHGNEQAEGAAHRGGDEAGRRPAHEGGPGAARGGQDGARRAAPRPQAEATRLRTKAGQPQLTDGPFAETKEVVGGFYLIDCASKAEAVEWASKLPLREEGFIEVRPVWEM